MDERRWIVRHPSGEERGVRGLFTMRRYAEEVVRGMRLLGERWIIKDVTGKPQYNGMRIER